MEHNGTILFDGFGLFRQKAAPCGGKDGAGVPLSDCPAIRPEWVYTRWKPEPE